METREQAKLIIFNVSYELCYKMKEKFWTLLLNMFLFAVIPICLGVCWTKSKENWNGLPVFLDLSGPTSTPLMNQYKKYRHGLSSSSLSYLQNLPAASSNLQYLPSTTNPFRNHQRPSCTGCFLESVFYNYSLTSSKKSL